jgi:hypothetical protein
LNKRYFIVAVALILPLSSQADDYLPTVRSSEQLSKLETLQSSGLTLRKTNCKNFKIIDTKQVANTFDSSITDTVKTLKCQGMEVGIYIASSYSPPLESLAWINISEEVSKPLPFGLRLGISRAFIRNIFGEPDLEEPERLSFLVPQEGPCDGSVAFKFHNDKLVRFEWGFCIN